MTGRAVPPMGPSSRVGSRQWAEAVGRKCGGVRGSHGADTGEASHAMTGHAIALSCRLAIGYGSRVHLRTADGWHDRAHVRRPSKTRQVSVSSLQGQSSSAGQAGIWPLTACNTSGSKAANGPR